MRNAKMGCLLWVALFLMLVLWGWKLIDFYVLGPAVIKKGMNETIDQVSRMNNTSAKQVEFLSRWSEWRRTGTTLEFTTSAFQGDSFIVEWTDTLHVPIFPSIPHDFRLSRIIL